MKWQIDFGDRPWHRWFAWYPVRLNFEHNGTRVWWEYVERQKENVQGWMITRYRPLTESPATDAAVSGTPEGSPSTIRAKGI